MPIEFEELERLIAKKKRLKKKQVPKVKEKIEPLVVENSSRSFTSIKPLPVPSPPPKQDCPLALVENCTYGFMTEHCCFCHSLRSILNDSRITLPENANAVNKIIELAKEESIEDFSNRLDDELKIDQDSIEYATDRLMELVENELDETGLAGLSSNQLEILKAFKLLKEEPEGSIILGALEELATTIRGRVTGEL